MIHTLAHATNISLKEPLLILITGLPCTGKTSLGNQIARDFAIPFIYKDLIKESLFDTLGCSDREASRRLSVASYQILYRITEAILKSGQSLVVEANFDPVDARNRLQLLLSRQEFIIFEVNCVMPGDVLMQRFQQRWKSGKRHNGHMDSVVQPEIEKLIKKGETGKVAFTKSSIQIDTSDFNSINYQGLLQTISMFAGRNAE